MAGVKLNHLRLVDEDIRMLNPAVHAWLDRLVRGEDIRMLNPAVHAWLDRLLRGGRSTWSYISVTTGRSAAVGGAVVADGGILLVEARVAICVG